jgi:hypothetical protein
VARRSHGVAPPERPLTEVLRKRECVVRPIKHLEYETKTLLELGLPLLGARQSYISS